MPRDIKKMFLERYGKVPKKKEIDIFRNWILSEKDIRKWAAKKQYRNKKNGKHNFNHNFNHNFIF